MLSLHVLSPGPRLLHAEAVRSLLRNEGFQDDWLTLLPEVKNHHWCYSSEFVNRRDMNPDGWTCRGSWTWYHADASEGQRQFVLSEPSAEVTQRVNWVAVHDDRAFEGFPDAGGFPVLKSQRTSRPLRVVRDLTLRVLLRGKDVPPNAGRLELGWCPPGGITSADPLGALTPPTVSVTAILPAGTFGARWVELRLPSEAWRKAAEAESAKDVGQASEGLALPASARVSIRYQAAGGSILLERAELLSSDPDGPNLLPDGGFERSEPDGWPIGWNQPERYSYFPPKLYYIFNTWHNNGFENRGPVRPDSLVTQHGRRSLKMVVAAGDEISVASTPVPLLQREPRLIEVSAWIKTDRLNLLQIDALDEQGDRLDGFNFIHKAPVSIGTDDWRLIRQVFRPRRPVQSVRILLCARGVNGFTLDDTDEQPQNNVVGTIWWDGVQLHEPESTAEELTSRGLKAAMEGSAELSPHLEDLDLGERLLGDNVLGATVVNPGPPASFGLSWQFTSASGRTTHFRSQPQSVPANGRVRVQLPYILTETCPKAYTEYHGTLTLLDGESKPVHSSELWFGMWTTPIDLELGRLYLEANQPLLVRMNFGFSAATIARLQRVRLEIVRRGTEVVLSARDVAATPDAIRAQRNRIPLDLRGDFRNLLLADLDVSSLPLQSFHDPQRNWYVRASALDVQGEVVGRAESAPFCRQAHEPKQPAIASLRVQGDLLYVNERPWFPWGATYGHVPVYSGPADPGPGKYRDLHSLPEWSIYDRFTAATYDRRHNDLNCLRYVAGSITDPKVLGTRWLDDNLYCSSAFVVPEPVFSTADLTRKAGGPERLKEYLNFCRKAPMVVSVAPGIEEAFGTFHAADAAQLKGLAEVVDHLRQESGKPVMVGHGGYWNRFEFEKVPFFDIYDPETEPLYPANLHTDLAPLLSGKDKVIWLRPQMYEDIPYERWRFHTYVELMRGCRGWQFAHGPGDPSLFRGLHGELEFWKPIVTSPDPGPVVTITPAIEHWSRRLDGKIYMIAATTHGIPLGQWQWSVESAPDGHRCRSTLDPDSPPKARIALGIEENPQPSPSVHGIQFLPDARRWPKASKLTQWVWLDPERPPRNLVVLVKADGRWTHAASWGKVDLSPWRKDPLRASRLLHTLYPHADGFLGWDLKLLDRALVYLPETTVDRGTLPAPSRWTELEVPLGPIGADDHLVDGAGFLHEGGRLLWGPTTIVAPDGTRSILWGDSIGPPPDTLKDVQVHLPGLKAGSRVRVLFEDRERVASEGAFTDDFRGRDLYQRYGGANTGYGDIPVSVHAYEIPAQ